MSSFRPDRESAEHAFVAHPFLRSEANGLGADAPSLDDSIAFVSEEQPGAESGRGAEGSGSDETLYSEADVEGLVNAAFERGAEAARVETALVESAFAGLSAASQACLDGARSSIGANRGAIVELASEIARRWVGLELRQDAEQFVGCLSAAIEAAEPEEASTIRLNPEDLTRIEREASASLESILANGAVSLVADPSVASSEFQLDVGARSIDARADTILERLREALSVMVAGADVESAGDVAAESALSEGGGEDTADAAKELAGESDPLDEGLAGMPAPLDEGADE